MVTNIPASIRGVEISGSNSVLVIFGIDILEKFHKSSCVKLIFHAFGFYLKFSSQKRNVKQLIYLRKYMQSINTIMI